MKIIGDCKQLWYGPGYCGVCGTSGDSLIPVPVRFWDCDDGWKVGVLCGGCGEECAKSGPSPENYAFPNEKKREAIDAVADLLGEDMDGPYSTSV